MNALTACMCSVHATYPKLLRNVDPIDLSRSVSYHELFHSVDLRLRPLGVIKSRMALACPLDLTRPCRPEVIAQSGLRHLRTMLAA